MYAAQFIRWTWLFDIVGTDEIAETSLNFSGDVGWSLAQAVLGDIDAGAGQDDVANAMDACLTDAAGWADYSRLLGTKVAAIGTDGHYLTDPIVYELDSPSQGSTDNVPAQSTVVVSLRTESSLGKGNYGRMYLPHYRMDQNNASPYAALTTATDLRASAQTLINSVWSQMNTWSTHETAPVIMGQTGSGTVKPITKLGVGRLTDTQRRRRNRLDDTAVLADL